MLMDQQLGLGKLPMLLGLKLLDPELLLVVLVMLLDKLRWMLLVRLVLLLALLLLLLGYGYGSANDAAVRTITTRSAGSTESIDGSTA